MAPAELWAPAHFRIDLIEPDAAVKCTDLNVKIVRKTRDDLPAVLRAVAVLEDVGLDEPPRIPVGEDLLGLDPPLAFEKGLLDAAKEYGIGAYVGILADT